MWDMNPVLFHIGGDLDGQWAAAPESSPGLNYRSVGGTAYLIHRLPDGTEVMAESRLCYREVKMYYSVLSNGTGIPPAPAAVKTPPPLDKPVDEPLAVKKTVSNSKSSSGGQAPSGSTKD